MRRLAALLLVLGLVSAACGGAGGDAGTVDTEASPTSEATATTGAADDDPADDPTTTSSADVGSESTVAAGPPVSGVDGPPAPPNAVPFEGGNDIELSQEVLPVYLVFWAEW